MPCYRPAADSEEVSTVAQARSSRRVALTGSPGTGKSAVARRLSATWSVAEVGALAIELGAGKRTVQSTQVDLAALAARFRSTAVAQLPVVVVGHLAHLLPIRDAIVLRCHPVELGRRLERAHRGRGADRRANVEAEATDVVLLEALGLGRRIWEVDTSGRSVADVAREVSSLVRRRPRARYGAVDWLGDPTVTDYLLRLDR